MIATLRGRVTEKAVRGVVIEAGGVGYDVAVSVTTLAALPEAGTEATLFVHTHVREDVLALYGFATREEREAFRLLLGVSGVGPKVATAVLSGLTAKDLADAVEERDVARLSRVNGIGKKMAERILMDLRGKTVPLAGPVEGRSEKRRTMDELAAALVSLGYSATEAERAAARLKDRSSESVESLLRDALKIVGKV
ncbi:MAG: Holliday junction branch migration protein RuvA [Deltaproteobacteria bacterium]|nr:Holliday junction branch migration protein RuvA [Deltaproteobacteria bacterium]